MDKMEYPNKRKGLADKVAPARKGRPGLTPKVSAKGKVTMPKAK